MLPASFQVSFSHPHSQLLCVPPTMSCCLLTGRLRDLALDLHRQQDSVSSVSRHTMLLLRLHSTALGSPE